MLGSTIAQCGHFQVYNNFANRHIRLIKYILVHVLNQMGEGYCFKVIWLIEYDYIIMWRYYGIFIYVIIRNFWKIEILIWNLKENYSYYLCIACAKII